MKLAVDRTQIDELNWFDALLAAFDLGTANVFNVDWLIDKAETGEWSGLWW